MYDIEQQTTLKGFDENTQSLISEHKMQCFCQEFSLLTVYFVGAAYSNTYVICHYSTKTENEKWVIEHLDIEMKVLYREVSNHKLYSFVMPKEDLLVYLDLNQKRNKKFVVFLDLKNYTKTNLVYSSQPYTFYDYMYYFSYSEYLSVLTDTSSKWSSKNGKKSYEIRYLSNQNLIGHVKIAMYEREMCKPRQGDMVSTIVWAYALEESGKYCYVYRRSNRNKSDYTILGPLLPAYKITDICCLSYNRYIVLTKQSKLPKVYILDVKQSHSRCIDCLFAPQIYKYPNNNRFQCYNLSNMVLLVRTVDKLLSDYKYPAAEAVFIDCKTYRIIAIEKWDKVSPEEICFRVNYLPGVISVPIKLTNGESYFDIMEKLIGTKDYKEFLKETQFGVVGMMESIASKVGIVIDDDLVKDVLDIIEWGKYYKLNKIWLYE